MSKPNKKSKTKKCGNGTSIKRGKKRRRIFGVKKGPK